MDCREDVSAVDRPSFDPSHETSCEPVCKQHRSGSPPTNSDELLHIKRARLDEPSSDSQLTSCLPLTRLNVLLSCAANEQLLLADNLLSNELPAPRPEDQHQCSVAETITDAILESVSQSVQKLKSVETETTMESNVSVEIQSEPHVTIHQVENKPNSSTGIGCVSESEHVGFSGQRTMHCEQPGVGLIAHAGGLFQASADHFLKGVKWSPDGRCILANSGSNSLHVFDVPDCVSSNPTLTELVSNVKITPGEVVYDFCWHPTGVNRHTSVSAGCFVTTARDHPVHMWDTTSGAIRCSYRAFDHVDELAAAYSLAFSPDGQRLYCGYNKMIRVFDVERPGRTFQARPTFLKQGQSGIISCIAFSKADPTVYAAGSYARTVALYSEPSGSMMCMFQGQLGGVTHVQFSPDGTRLFSGGRKDREILCWDIRNPGNILFTLQRQVTTNQRMYFDIDSTGRYVMSGNQDGSVSVWDSLSGARVQSTGGEAVLEPTLSFRAHNDTVSSIGCHPASMTVVTGSGQRHFRSPAGAADSDVSDVEDDKNDYDNSLKVWTIDVTPS